MKTGVLLGWAMLLVACTKVTATNDAPVSTANVMPTASTTPAPSAPATATSGACEGLAKTPCVLQPGCILDQPGGGKYVCRDAANACEKAARHGDVIGHDVTGVTDAAQRDAVAACTATSGCVVAGGKCSCTCAVFGNCNCACGGGWLERCVRASDAKTLEGYPGSGGK